MSAGLPSAPRLVAALEEATRAAEIGGRQPDEVDLLHALAGQVDAVAGKALAAYQVSARSSREAATLVGPRSCRDVLDDAEDFAAADGSFFVATEHVLCALLRPQSDAWNVVASAGVDPRLVRGQVATEASELGRPTQVAEVRARGSGVATAWMGSARSSAQREAGSSTAERVAAEIAACEAVVGLAVVTFGGGQADIAVWGSCDLWGRTSVGSDSPFRIGSLTKVLTAMAVLALAERGVVSLDAPVGECLTSVRVEPPPGPTLRQLLTHTGGVPAGAYLHTPDELAPAFADVVGVVELDAAPGERWVYSNIGYGLVGQALEDMSGTPFDCVLEDTVLRPLGMVETSVNTQAMVELPTGHWIDRGEVVAAPRRDIILRPAGGCVSTASDLASLVAFLAAPGHHPDPPLSSEAVRAMFEPQGRHIGPAADASGLAFWLRTIDGRPVGWHPGRISGFPSAIYVTTGAGSVVMTNTENLTVAHAAARAVRDLMREAS